MSHDRGCGDCGRDRGEYDDCKESKCIKRSSAMKDTDWRPSPCPSCGEMRNAAKHPKCDNKHCDVGPFINSKETRSMKTERHYIWSKQGHALVMVNDLEWLYRNPEFDSKSDKIYELGPEVKIEMTVKVIPAKPVTREHTSVYRTTFENRD